MNVPGSGGLVFRVQKVHDSGCRFTVEVHDSAGLIQFPIQWRCMRFRLVEVHSLGSLIQREAHDSGVLVQSCFRGVFRCVFQGHYSLGCRTSLSNCLNARLCRMPQGLLGTMLLE